MSEVLEPENIIFISCLSKDRLCIFLSNVEPVKFTPLNKNQNESPEVNEIQKTTQNLNQEENPETLHTQEKNLIREIDNKQTVHTDIS